MEFRSRASGGSKVNMSFNALMNLSSNGDLDIDDALLVKRSAVSDGGLDGRVRKRRIRGSRKKRMKKGKDGGGDLVYGDDQIVEEENGECDGGGFGEVICENGVDRVSEYCVISGLSEEVVVEEGGGGRSSVVDEVAEVWSNGKLRQRNWSGSGGGTEEVTVVSCSTGVYDENGKEAEDRGIDFISTAINEKLESNENGIGRLETLESLDWKQIMAEDPSCEY